MNAILGWVSILGTVVVAACSSESESATDATQQPGPDAGTKAGPDASGKVESDASTDTPIENLPRVRYVGRFDLSDPEKPKVAWPGTKWIIHFWGSEVRAKVSQENGKFVGPSYFDAIVDGVVSPQAIAANDGSVETVLAKGLSLGEHTLELVKRTESIHGTVTLEGLRFPEGGRLLTPQPARPHRIEVLTNSAISGYGMEGAGPICTPSNPPISTNSRRSAPLLAGDLLNADVSLLAYSGKGLTANITAGDTVLMPALFTRVLPDAPTIAWDFSRFSPEAFVYVVSTLDIDTPEPMLTQAHTAFVQNVRQKYPQAFIFLALSPLASDGYPAGQMTRSRLFAMQNAVAAARNAAGDARVYSYAFTTVTGADSTGCAYHPNPAKHQAMATELAGWIRSRTGW